MSAFYIMIGVSMAIAFVFLGAFIWSVRKGHYDDDYTPSVRILMDDVKPGDTLTEQIPALASGKVLATSFASKTRKPKTKLP
ncbi:cbb3-type cytochrome oxidase assembly protein CcoS [Dyadobacter sp. 32]|uniref:cbb3-type cytochrome oxidase assembly protein CcoS n=1 Tax=Dyadobacter sp. 32 TaxID=538966 RepID=UPI0011EC0E3E